MMIMKNVPMYGRMLLFIWAWRNHGHSKHSWSHRPDHTSNQGPQVRSARPHGKSATWRQSRDQTTYWNIDVRSGTRSQIRPDVRSGTQGQIGPKRRQIGGQTSDPRTDVRSEKRRQVGPITRQIREQISDRRPDDRSGLIVRSARQDVRSEPKRQIRNQTARTNVWSLTWRVVEERIYRLLTP